MIEAERSNISQLMDFSAMIAAIEGEFGTTSPLGTCQLVRALASYKCGVREYLPAVVHSPTPFFVLDSSGPA